MAVRAAMISLSILVGAIIMVTQGASKWLNRYVSPEVQVIEDIIAQSHMVIDALNFNDGVIALSALRSIDGAQSHAGPFTKLLGVKFLEIGSGKCKASLEVRQHHLNPHGIAHGGVAFSLADSTCGGAALSALGEPRIVTQDMQIRYHGPARSGVVMAEAEVLHHGQRTVTTLCRVSQNGTLIATVTATFAILSDQELKLLKSDEGS